MGLLCREQSITNEGKISIITTINNKISIQYLIGIAFHIQIPVVFARYYLGYDIFIVFRT